MITSIVQGIGLHQVLNVSENENTISTKNVMFYTRMAMVADAFVVAVLLTLGSLGLHNGFLSHDVSMGLLLGAGIYGLTGLSLIYLHRIILTLRTRSWIDVKCGQSSEGQRMKKSLSCFKPETLAIALFALITLGCVLAPNISSHWGKVEWLQTSVCTAGLGIMGYYLLNTYRQKLKRTPQLVNSQRDFAIGCVALIMTLGCVLAAIAPTPILGKAEWLLAGLGCATMGFALTLISQRFKTKKPVEEDSSRSSRSSRSSKVSARVDKLRQDVRDELADRDPLLKQDLLGVAQTSAPDDNDDKSSSSSHLGDSMSGFSSISNSPENLSELPNDESGKASSVSSTPDLSPDLSPSGSPGGSPLTMTPESPKPKEINPNLQAM